LEVRLMAESYDRKTSLSITDDMIKEALKSGLSSIKSSDTLINRTLEKCENVITEDKKQSKKSRSFMNMVYKFGAPLAAGALVLVLIFTIPGVYNSGKTAAPQAPMASAAFDSASTNSILEAAPAAPAPNNSDEITVTFGYGEVNGSNKDEFAENKEDGGSLLGAEERSGNEEQFMMQSVPEPQDANEFSVFLGDRFISLEDRSTDENLVSVLNSVLGEPNSESVKLLDESSDTFEGMTVKTLEYDGITVIISGTRTFSISSMEITHDKYSTYRGISVGMSVNDLKAKYENITIVLDGRTDPDNCGYVIEDSDYFIWFEVQEGLIAKIKYYSEIG
jgi:hypothetical protein